MRKHIILLIAILILAGCATTSQVTSRISLGMTKQEVIKLCGQPYKFGATIDTDGEPIEAITYREYIYSNSLGYATPPPPTFTNIYFKNGKVVQYGSGNDWKTFADYEGERKVKITKDENIRINQDK